MVLALGSLIWGQKDLLGVGGVLSLPAKHSKQAGGRVTQGDRCSLNLLPRLCKAFIQVDAAYDSCFLLPVALLRDTPPHTRPFTCPPHSPGAETQQLPGLIAITAEMLVRERGLVKGPNGVALW